MNSSWLPLLGLVAVTVTPLAAADSAIEYPKLHDERLQISLYASDPDIVTPIGATVDADGRLFVIECHTHNPPADYDGPQGDVIKVFEGQRPDGTYRKMSVFADNLFQAQALTFDSHGTLYVVCTREVLILHDRDRDLRSESRTRILNLDPYEKRGNPHGQMQGIAFSNDGWLYVGAGTTEDDWISSDGQRLKVGPYWGGIIARCRPDGTQLERIAWGFWNPYGIAFDRHGRLLAIDNDPDHRGPNRLLHIVKGGDYGYKRQYGRYGLHPYQAWEGELPGTLPMIAGIGEAPTALVSANDASLPLDYRDAILGASWGEHNLTVFRPHAAGVSLTATPEVLVEGRGHDDMVSPFRPSGMAANSVDGAIYVCDWMLINYTTHKKGRIWRISTKPDVAKSPPRRPYSEQESIPELARLQRISDASELKDYPLLRQEIVDPDPFVRSAALAAMARPVYRDLVVRDLEDRDAKVRLGALLALRRADVADPKRYIEPRLADPDLEVVQMAMIWAGEQQATTLTQQIDRAASKSGLTKAFFQTWLATMQIMEQAANPVEVSSDRPAYRRSPYYANRQLSPAFVGRLARDELRPAPLRAMAIRWIQDLELPETHAFLRKTARDADLELQVEAIRRLGESTHAEAATTLLALGKDRTRSPAARTEAIAALAAKPDPSLAALLDDPEPQVRLEAARSLRQLAGNPAVRDAVARKLSTVADDRQQLRLRSQLEYLLAPEKVVRPSSVSGWQSLLQEGGDPKAGERVFFSANLACTQCHSVGGRGVKLGSGSTAGFIAMPFGPDLSVVGRKADRNALIRAIVDPSEFVAPEYQGWFVEMEDGQITSGLEIDQERRSIQLITLDGHERNFPREEIASWGALKKSLMPEDLPKSMAIEEFRDLIAYLRSLN